MPSQEYRSARATNRFLHGPAIARRSFLAGGSVFAAVACRAATLDDDGMWHENWFDDGLLDLSADLADATAEARRLVVMWERPGSPACRETHEKNLANPGVAGFIRTYFDVVQLNRTGARAVTFPDGTRVAESLQAERCQIASTPTFQFFAGPNELAHPGAEVGRLSGYVPPLRFVGFFRFIRDRAYEQTGFERWFQRHG